MALKLIHKHILGLYKFFERKLKYCKLNKEIHKKQLYLSKNLEDQNFGPFYYAWEQRKLEDLANRYDNLRVPVSAINRVAGDIPYYGANGIQDYVDGYTHNGEFILVAEDGANDLKNYPVQYVNGYFWANNHTHVLQAKPTKANNLYLKYCISNTNIENLLVGGGRAKLNANVLMEIPINKPTNTDEQTQIGNLFYKIDTLITLHQRKYEKLLSAKKAFLEKMFPANGSSKPTLRFKGFTDAWEQRKLGEVCQITMGQSPEGYNF